MRTGHLSSVQAWCVLKFFPDALAVKQLVQTGGWIRSLHSLVGCARLHLRQWGGRVQFLHSFHSSSTEPPLDCFFEPGFSNRNNFEMSRRFDDSITSRRYHFFFWIKVIFETSQNSVRYYPLYDFIRLYFVLKQFTKWNLPGMKDINSHQRVGWFRLHPPL